MQIFNFITLCERCYLIGSVSCNPANLSAVRRREVSALRGEFILVVTYIRSILCQRFCPPQGGSPLLGVSANICSTVAIVTYPFDDAACLKTGLANSTHTPSPTKLNYANSVCKQQYSIPASNILIRT